MANNNYFKRPMSYHGSPSCWSKYKEWLTKKFLWSWNSPTYGVVITIVNKMSTGSFIVFVEGLSKNLRNVLVRPRFRLKVESVQPFVFVVLNPLSSEFDQIETLEPNQTYKNHKNRNNHKDFMVLSELEILAFQNNCLLQKCSSFETVASAVPNLTKVLNKLGANSSGIMTNYQFTHPIVGSSEVIFWTTRWLTYITQRVPYDPMCPINDRRVFSKSRIFCQSK